LILLITENTREQLLLLDGICDVDGDGSNELVHLDPGLKITTTSANRAHYGFVVFEIPKIMTYKLLELIPCHGLTAIGFSDWIFDLAQVAVGAFMAKLDCITFEMCTRHNIIS
jgi:hypothetical protein